MHDKTRGNAKNYMKSNAYPRLHSKEINAQAGLLHHAGGDSIAYEWKTTDTAKHDWVALRDSVEDYIKSLNFGILVNLGTERVDYKNAFVQFKDKNTVIVRNKKHEETTITASQILVAVGGRKEDALCISSDDLFSLEKYPGKVLVVGASYIAVECSGFLEGLGMETTMMIRSSILRGFNTQMAEKIEEIQNLCGVTMLIGWVPELIEKAGDRLKVTAKKNTGETMTETYDNIVLAIGREPCTSQLNLGSAGVQINSETKNIIVDKRTKSSVSNIYAVGDCAEGRPELTPPAIKAGTLLARRIFGGSSTVVNYTNVASVVFAPIEYGFVGLTEKQAIEKWGERILKITSVICNL